MPSLSENCKTIFNCTNLYELFSLNQASEPSPQKIKRAYYKKSLEVHPDRVEASEKEEATTKFQVLGQAYAILSNEEKRKIYDETGQIDEEDSGPPSGGDWETYWRLLYKKITVHDIRNFEENYKGSEEEREDLFAAYEEGQGDMDHILDTVLCCNLDDESRFSTILNEAISAGTIPAYKSFVKESKTKAAARKKRMTAERQEAEEAANELNLDGTEESLRAALQMRASQRESRMDNLLASLEQKYAPKPKQKKKAPRKKP